MEDFNIEAYHDQLNEAGIFDKLPPIQDEIKKLFPSPELVSKFKKKIASLSKKFSEGSINDYLNVIQIALDIAGIEPTVGSAADITNAVISGLRAAAAKLNKNKLLPRLEDQLDEIEDEYDDVEDEYEHMVATRQSAEANKLSLILRNLKKDRDKLRAEIEYIKRMNDHKKHIINAGLSLVAIIPGSKLVKLTKMKRGSTAAKRTMKNVRTARKIIKGLKIKRGVDLLTSRIGAEDEDQRATINDIITQTVYESMKYSMMSLDDFEINLTEKNILSSMEEYLVQEDIDNEIVEEFLDDIVIEMAYGPKDKQEYVRALQIFNNKIS